MPRNPLPAIESTEIVCLNEAPLSAALPVTQPARSTECPVAPRRTSKQALSRLPRPKVVRIQQRYIAGENQSQIAKAEGCDRETVARIVKSSEMAEYIERMKEEFRGLIPDALAAVRYSLQVQKDARIAYEILRDTGVAPKKGDTAQVPEITPEDGYEQEARAVASVLIEGHRNFGLDLPPNIEEALERAHGKV